MTRFILSSLVLCVATQLLAAHAKDQATCLVGVASVLFAFQEQNFTGDAFTSTFREESLLTFPQVGQFKGTAEIAEYFSLFLDSPYVVGMPEEIASTLHFNGYDSNTTICEFTQAMEFRGLMNANTTRNMAEVQFVIMNKVQYSLEQNFVTHFNVFWPVGVLEMFFGNVLDSDNTRDFVCSVLLGPCADYIIEPPLTTANCLDRLAVLPVLEESQHGRVRVDGNSQGCRALHAGFASDNPKGHCAHVSLEQPTLDPLNRTKCFESGTTEPDDFYDAADYELFESFANERGIPSEPGHNLQLCVLNGNCDDTNMTSSIVTTADDGPSAAPVTRAPSGASTPAPTTTSVPPMSPASSFAMSTLVLLLGSSLVQLVIFT